MTDPQKTAQPSMKGDEKAAPQEVPADEPIPLEEYHYYVGYMETTAMMTPEMAEQVGAVPIDEPLDEPDGGKKGNNEANRLSTRNREADDAGVTNKDNEDARDKARNARNKRATGSGGPGDSGDRQR
jgi:hypothetical protein